ncbi:phosphoserine phosphatase [Bacillus sp. Soil745]|uniref:SpoIIE family protein phosphatase n=1 Tax=Peribacillus frigoritolerans TaxID=450367 RepID=UPI0007100CCD|nr:SpoIIE family protein phosphatase [Peribacillus frigoritolerans]KRF51998.1 phosphoserine phosphatase [Bacillus sp. Soil745]MED3710119.1 SpoIIE family protein phosphatase [Peribacillus frigoritolerans]PAW30584.1 phosphoserine phosphatase [Peribacillus simplex]
MNEQLNEAPCGYLTLSEEDDILSVNLTLLKLLGYNLDQLQGQPINYILSASAILFHQLYLVPLIKLENQIEEIYISLKSVDDEEIPVLLNAVQRERDGRTIIECVVIPMRKRNELENELLIAKKEAETALNARNKAYADLEIAHETMKMQKNKLIELNEKNEKFKVDTERELGLAKKIQETLLPVPIINEHLEIQAYYKGSNQLSGDIYGFYQIDPQRYGLILLDVMGHGLSSALITMSLHSIFEKLILKGSEVKTVMKELDDHLHSLFKNTSKSSHYCTAVYLLIDTDKREINYINAGHPSVLLQDINGKQYELRSNRPPLGMFEDILFKTNTVTYNKESMLCLYTDGVEEPIGSDRLCSLLKTYSAAPLSTLKEEVIQSLRYEEDTLQRKDDQCLILVKLK